MEASYLMRKRCDQNSFHESLSSSDYVMIGCKGVLSHYIYFVFCRSQSLNRTTQTLVTFFFGEFRLRLFFTGGRLGIE